MGGIRLAAVAAEQHISLSTLRALNPALVGDRIPPTATAYAIRLPATETTAVSPEL
jgi:hypothetical protein